MHAACGRWIAPPESRPLVQAEGVTAPAISGDRAWVAYRLVKGNSNEVWAVPSSGGDARLLLAERDLSGGLPQGYRERRIQDVRWLPGKRVLVVTTQLTPVAQDAAPQLEMWTVDIASGARKLLASGDARQRPIIAPNGAQIAFFRRAPEKAGEGSLWLIGADGGGERAVLRFPARPDARSFDGQIAWLPDSSGLWAAVPDAGQPNALTLYRVPLNGEAQPAGRVEGSEAFWSPNGARLAYTRLTGEASWAEGSRTWRQPTARIRNFTRRSRTAASSAGRPTAHASSMKTAASCSWAHRAARRNAWRPAPSSRVGSAPARSCIRPARAIPGS